MIVDEEKQLADDWTAICGDLPGVTAAEKRDIAARSVKRAAAIAKFVDARIRKLVCNGGDVEDANYQLGFSDGRRAGLEEARAVLRRELSAELAEELSCLLK